MNRREFAASLSSLTAMLSLTQRCRATDSRGAARIQPVDLRCEYLVDPLGADVVHPRLSWRLESSDRGQLQTAYQILVASSAQLLSRDQGDFWDSGKVQSEHSTHIAYGGERLGFRRRCSWKVRVWDRQGDPSEWSAPAMWGMGLLEPGDWLGHWIQASATNLGLPMFRVSFQVASPVRLAELFLCGLGHFEARINGQPAGDSVLDPGWTNYRKICLYRTFDITQRIVPGENVLGVLLGNGMYHVTGGRYTKFVGSFGPPKLIAQLHLDFSDGTSECYATGPSWRTAPGPLTFSCIYGGEDYDARREPAGWDRPGFNAKGWSAASVTEGPGGELSSRSAPPIRIMQEFHTTRVTRPKPGVYVYDLGQNFSGWPWLSLTGPAGARVKLITGELVDHQGLVTQVSSGSPVWFSYTLKGEGTETWHPRFSYTGFRYVQVEGAVPAHQSDAPAGLPRIQELKGQFIHSSVATVGEVSCSNPEIERIHRLITAAIRSNLQSVLTDCPHREKWGWLEVSHLLASGIAYNFDVPAFYTKICEDMRAAQLENGLVPDVAPEYHVNHDGFRDSPEWGSAYVLDPWFVWQMYGDRRVLEEHYEGMRRYVAYLGSRAKGDILSYGLGDWYDVGPKNPGESQLTSKGLTATAIYYQDIEVMRQVAALLGRVDEARTYTELANRLRAAFNAKYFDPATHQYDRGSQTANAMPLALGLVDEAQRPAVLANLVKDIRGRKNRVTAGDVGFAYVVRALTEAGRGDVLYDMICQSEGPGYVYQLRRGATTLTEAWDADPRSSQNHCMLGHAEEWFFRGLGGIRSDPSGPGFSRFIIRPQRPRDVTWAKVSYRSIRGTMANHWERSGDKFTMEFTVPANTSATVYIPARGARSVTEAGQLAAEVPGVRFLRMEGQEAVFEVPSGTYRFNSVLPEDRSRRPG
jgi:alpha-L-rhamnosidase